MSTSDAANRSDASVANHPILGKIQGLIHEPDQERYYGHMRLGMIKYDETIKNYRIAKAYKPAQLENLKKSLVVRNKLNLLNPLHTIMDATAGVLRTIGGNRRLASLKALTEKDNSGKSTLTEDTLVPVYIYDTDKRCDALRRAMMDNAFRRDFNDYERLTAIEDMDHTSMSSTEIATSMNVSPDTIARFLDIARHSTLRAFLKENILPYSKLAQLGKCIEKGDDVSNWITEILIDWKKKAEKEKDEYVIACKRNGKKALGAKLKLQSYLKASTWNCWIEALSNGEKPNERDAKEKKINFAFTGNTLVIEGVKRDLTNASIDQLTDDMLALKHATKVLEATLARVKAGETKASDFRESKEYLEEYEKLTGKKPDFAIRRSSGQEGGAASATPSSGDRPPQVPPATNESTQESEEESDSEGNLDSEPDLELKDADLEPDTESDDGEGQ